MAEVTTILGTVFTIYQNAEAVIAFLKQLTDDTVMLKCEIPSNNKVKTVVFEAFEHRSFPVIALSGMYPAWAEDKRESKPSNAITAIYSLFSTTPPPHDPAKGSTKFKTIEIVCDNEDQVQHILLEFKSKSFTQYAVIDYLKIISRKYNKVTIEVKRTASINSRLDSSRSCRDDPFVHEERSISWTEWKLTYILNSRII